MSCLYSARRRAISTLWAILVNIAARLHLLRLRPRDSRESGAGAAVMVQGDRCPRGAEALTLLPSRLTRYLSRGETLDGRSA